MNVNHNTPNNFHPHKKPTDGTTQPPFPSPQPQPQPILIDCTASNGKVYTMSKEATNNLLFGILNRSITRK